MTNDDIAARRRIILAKLNDNFTEAVPTVDEVLSFQTQGYYITRRIFNDEEIDAAFAGTEEHYAGHRDWQLPTQLVRAYLDWKPVMGDGLRAVPGSFDSC